MKQITDVISKIYDNPELRRTCIPLFLSNPGNAKSQTIHQFAKDRGVKLVEVIASTKMPNEISGIFVPDYNTQKMTCFNYDLFDSLVDGDIVFFDELLNSNIMVLNACLTILENRTLLSGKKLPDVMIVAAANRQGATQLTPQIKERFIWYDVALTKEDWKTFMYNKYQITDDIYEGLWSLVKNETFLGTEQNYFSPRSVDKAVNMMINGVSTPYGAKLYPILNMTIENTFNQDITIGDYTFKAGERKSWLEIQKLKINAITTK